MQNMSGVFSSIQEQSAGGFQTAIFKIRKSAAYTISCTNIFWNGTNKFMNSILKTVQLLIEGNGKLYEYGRCVLKQTTYEEKKIVFRSFVETKGFKILMQYILLFADLRTLLM